MLTPLPAAIPMKPGSAVSRALACSFLFVQQCSFLNYLVVLGLLLDRGHNVYTVLLSGMCRGMQTSVGWGTST